MHVIGSEKGETEKICKKEWLNFSRLKKKCLFIWLYRVLVVALGIFYLHCGIQDLLLCHANS